VSRGELTGLSIWPYGEGVGKRRRKSRKKTGGASETASAGVGVILGTIAGGVEPQCHKGRSAHEIEQKQSEEREKRSQRSRSHSYTGRGRGQNQKEAKAIKQHPRLRRLSRYSKRKKEVGGKRRRDSDRTPSLLIHRDAEARYQSRRIQDYQAM